MNIYELIKELSRAMEDIVDCLADRIAYEPNKPIEDLLYETCNDDYMDIIYYSDAIDFIKEHWDDVDEVIKGREADSLFGAVRLASYNVNLEYCRKYWLDAVKLAIAYYLKKKGVMDIDPLQFKEYEAFVEDEIREEDCFEEVIEFIENRGAANED